MHKYICNYSQNFISIEVAVQELGGGFSEPPPPWVKVLVRGLNFCVKVSKSCTEVQSLALKFLWYL